MGCSGLKKRTLWILMRLFSQHSKRLESSLEASDFAKAHLIIHSFPLETVSVYDQYLKLNKITPRKISAIPLTEVALDTVNANMGVMCMPK